MEDDLSRVRDAQLPPDFEEWSKPVRWLVRTLVHLPTWTAHGFAVCTDEQLAEWRQCDARTIRRMRREAKQRGEIDRVFLRRGTSLPDGTRVRRGLWVLVDGPARRARHAATTHDERGRPSSPLPVSAPLTESVLEERTNSPPDADTLTADRSFDPLHSNEIKPALPEPDAPREPTATTRSTSFHLVEPTEGDAVAAHAIATHYARRTSKPWQVIRADVLAFVLGFVRAMNGSEANKVERASRVIDLVVDQAASAGAPPPSLRYVFHEKIFWRRLEALERPTSAPRAPMRSTNATPRLRPLRAFSAPQGGPVKAPAAPAVANVTEVIAMLVATIGLEPSTPSNRQPVATAEVDAEIAAMAEADNAARARLGLPPRYAAARAAAAAAA